MQSLITLALVFVASLAATSLVAWLFRIASKRPAAINILAIPIGITIAEGVRLRWQLSEVAFAFTLGAAAGAAAWTAQYLKRKHGA